jgi:hypothetical protein
MLLILAISDREGFGWENARIPLAPTGYLRRDREW